MLTALFLQGACGLAVTTAPKATPAAISCPYCGAVVTSRNKLYAHLRSSAPCGEQAVAVDGLDLEAGRPQATRKVALTFGYAASSNERAVARLRDALRAIDGAEVTTLTCATNHTYRRSELLRSTYPAVADTAVYSTHAARNDSIDAGPGKAAWLGRLNAALASSSRSAGDEVTVFDREYLHADHQRLNAEQACSARELACLVPWTLLGGEDTVDDAAAEATVTRLKATLRALLPPKSAASGGYKHRRSKVQAAWREQYRWHNFAASGTAVPADAAVSLVVDRFWTPAQPLVWRDPLSGRPFLRLHISAEGLLDGQAERMVGVAVCMARGLLPPDFGRVALDPRVVLETPALPRGLVYLRRARFGWEAAKMRIFRRRRGAETEARLAAFEASLQAAIARSDVASSAVCSSWLVGMEQECCPRVLKAAAGQGLLLHAAVPDAPGDAARRAPAAAATAGAPPAYANVLRLLREADRSGRWPSTSRARARVLHVDHPTSGGSFSLRAPCSAEGAAAWRGRETRGNAEFDELARAIFELEREIAPGRPPSTMVAVNRRATFLPHTDAGAGFGQSTSLIVGLGDYTAGELVVEGVSHNIRYAPLTFDGWRERHWTLPFEGERFSLVWFSPAQTASTARDGSVAARYAH